MHRNFAPRQSSSWPFVRPVVLPISIHERTSLHSLISSGVTSQVREGPRAEPRRNSSHLLSCLERPSHFLRHGLSVLAGLAMRSESPLLRSSRPECIAAPHSNKIATWIMVTMADVFSCTISAHTHLQRGISLPFFAATRVTSGHHDQRKSGH